MLTIFEKYKIIFNYLMTNDLVISRNADRSSTILGLGQKHNKDDIILISLYPDIDKYLIRSYPIVLIYYDDHAFIKSDLETSIRGYFRLSDTILELNDEDSLKLLLKLI